LFDYRVIPPEDAMKYMLLIYNREGCMTPDERTDCMVKSIGICNELAARGQFIDAAPLEPVATAVTVRVRGGRTLVTDGPFTETTEQLGGYYVLDLPDLDAAIAVAARLPPVTKGVVEIRPVVILDGVPAGRPASAATDPNARPYLLLCCHEEETWRQAGEDAHRAAMGEAVALTRELAENGSFLSAAPLHPAVTATSVRVRDGKRVVTDGPFAETREVVGGYYLIQAASREDAVQIAARVPGARMGSVEVRPVFDLAPLRNPS
jgi:hypothetical protein